METKTEWAHLPNAHIIDAILDSLKKHPEEWAAARVAARDAAWSAAWGARSALSALIAWDYSVDILRMPLEAITMLAKLNNPAAVLLLPTAQLIHKHPKVLTLERSI